MLQSRLLMAIITIKVKFLKVMLGDLKFARNKINFRKTWPSSVTVRAEPLSVFLLIEIEKVKDSLCWQGEFCKL